MWIYRVDEPRLGAVRMREWRRRARHAIALLASRLYPLRRPYVRLPDTLELRSQAFIAYRTSAAARRIAKLRSTVPVARRGNPQNVADRLGPEGVATLIDKGLQDFRRRSSSAWAKNALASFRISLARRSFLTSRSSALRRSRSDVLTPSRSPQSTSSRSIHPSNVWLVQPILVRRIRSLPTVTDTRPDAALAPCALRVPGRQ